MTIAQPIEVRDTRIVQITFRYSYDESARLVRASLTPSPGRVRFLADHIDFGVEMLHHHHESEDLLLYPTLIERVPELLWPQPWTASTRCSSPILTTRSRRSYRLPR